MSLISIVAAMDENRGIGKNNQLLCHLPADLHYFKVLTLGKPIIMGRKTHNAIGRALPGRLNMVLSREENCIQDVIVRHSLQEALLSLSEEPEVMVIGGGEIFKEALPLATQLYLTLIHTKLDADVFFPPFSEKEWHVVSAVERGKDKNNKYDITFYHYQRDNNKN